VTRTSAVRGMSLDVEVVGEKHRCPNASRAANAAVFVRVPAAFAADKP